MSGYQPIQGTSSVDLAQLNNIIAQLRNEQYVKIFKDDSGTRRVLLGKGKDGFYGFKVSKEGEDVYTAATSDLIFSSDNNTFKIGSTGTIDVTRIGSVDTGSALIATGSLSAPSFICFVYNPNASPQFTHQTPFIAYNLTGADSGKVTNSRRALYDPSTGVIKFIVEASSIAGNFASNETWRFRYYLLFETVQ